MADTPDASAGEKAAAPSASTDDAVWAALAHLGGIVGIVPSLVIFLVLGKPGSKTRIEAKEALNWQITFLIGFVVLNVVVGILGGIIVSAVAAFGTYPGNAVPGVVGIASAVLWIGNITLSVMGFLRVNAGGSYRYPFAVRLIK